MDFQEQLKAMINKKKSSFSMQSLATSLNVYSKNVFHIVLEDFQFKSHVLKMRQMLLQSSSISCHL